MIVPFAGNLELSVTWCKPTATPGEKPGILQAPSRFRSSLHCYVAETHQEAMEGFKCPVERYIEVFAEAVSSWAGRIKSISRLQ